MAAVAADGVGVLGLGAAAASEGEASGDIPFSHLMVAFGVIVAESAFAQIFAIGIADQLLVSGIRAFVQLGCLGFVLHPIFAADDPGIVLAYIFGFMILVSAHEAVARPKVTYPGMYRDGVYSLGASLLCTGAVLLLIVAPTPWYNAQYLIPLAGMLINNSLTGVALALNQMLDYLTTNKEYLEILLAFGATPWEAAWPGFAKSAQAALIPAINGMNVVGLVSIPGMMTGQILGGASPLKAAKYQIVITFLISGCTFMAVTCICFFTIRAFFDPRGRHDTSRLAKQSRLKVAQCLDPRAWWRRAAAGKASPGGGTPAAAAAAAPATGRGLSSKEEPLLSGSADESGAAASAASPLALLGPAASAPSSQPVALDIDLEGSIGGSRSLKATFQLRAREVACVLGPSGIGKSTLLKWICDLVPARSVQMRLAGRSSPEMSAQAWRRDVLYVHQSKAPLPGTPSELLHLVRGLKVQHGRLSVKDPSPMMRSFGLDPALLERPWGELSGGEAQRTMLSIALATQPACLLLDEPTSALDGASKELVECGLRSSDAAVLLVTHDEAQAARLGAATTFRISER